MSVDGTTTVEIEDEEAMCLGMLLMFNKMLNSVINRTRVRRNRRSSSLLSLETEKKNLVENRQQDVRME